MREFLGFGGYTRQPEGALSWQHLTFVGSLLLLMTVLAITLGIKNKKAGSKAKNRVLIAAALLIDGFEIFKIVVLCLRAESWRPILQTLPLFLCSIQLIAIPMAAFCKGKLRDAALDFVAIFGLLGAVMGTIGAMQNYNAYPVLCMDNVVSGLTHCISGFASLYVLIAGMAPLKKREMTVTYGILLGFCLAAYVANKLVDYNYMFLVSHDGTPYQVLYDMVGGHPVLYPAGVVGLFLLYITAFYGIHHLCTRKKLKV